MPSYPSRMRVPFCDELAHWLLAGLIVFMPAAYGAVHAWSEFVVQVACLALCGCLALRWLGRKRTGGLVWTPAYLPLACFILLAFLQVVPVPFSILELISPHTARIYQVLRDDGVGAFTLSLYPYATWHDLNLVVAAATIFVTVVNTVHRSAQVKRLLLLIAGAGAAMAALALLQGVFGNGHIYWIGPAEVQPNSGTFACHNHLSQFVNLSVMAMLACAMVRIHATFGRKWLRKSVLGEWFTSSDLRLVRWLVMAAVAGWIAVALSASRMGVGSAVLGIGALVTMVIRRQGKERSSPLIAVVLVGVAAAVLIGAQVLFERMSTLQSFDSYAGRWTVVTDLVPAFGDFPILGSGLGTFSAVYPMYDTGTVWQFASHAENEFAQLLMEMGILGSVCVVGFVVLIVRAGLRTARRMDDPVCTAVPALLAGLLTVAVHSWTDFGQHIPAVAGLSAIFCGLLVAIDRRLALRDAPTEAAGAAPAFQPGGNMGYFARWKLPEALVGMLACLLAISIPAALWRVLAEEFDRSALATADSLQKASWRGSQEQYTQLIEDAGEAVRLDPGNAQYRYRLAVYRWYGTLRGRTEAEIGKEITPEMRETAEQIVDEMIVAAARCPTMGALHCWRGQMEWWILGYTSGRDRVEQGLRTAQNEPIAWCAAARIAGLDGDIDLAYERFARAVRIKKGTLRTAAEFFAREVKRPDLAVHLAGDDADRLEQVAGILQQYDYQDAAEEARGHAVEQYRTRLDEPGLSAYAIALVAEATSREGRHQEAAALYRRATAKEYARLSWRIACARELAAAGHVDEAQNELLVCERLGADAKVIEQARRQVFAAASSPAATQAAETAPATRPAASPNEPGLPADVTGQSAL